MASINLDDILDTDPKDLIPQQIARMFNEWDPEAEPLPEHQAAPEFLKLTVERSAGRCSVTFELNDPGFEPIWVFRALVYLEGLAATRPPFTDTASKRSD